MISFNLTGKRAIVTGAASGIGLATAELLCKSGAAVALIDLPDNPALKESADRLQKEGYSALACPCNVADPKSVSTSFTSIIQKLDGLDFLVNNAGTPGTLAPLAPDDFESQDEAFWNKLLTVNLQGPARCTAASVQALRLSGGAIVNTASTAGIAGNGSSAPYAATKAGLIALTKEYARALGPDIRVNAIAPGIVDSPWECRFDIPEATLQKLPLQRRGVPADFAEAIVYLLAGASYITGHTLVLDGGLLSGPKV